MRETAFDIGIIGLGDIAYTHLKAWRKVNGVHVTAVCDTNEHIAKEKARAWNIPAYYTDVGEMFGKEELSAVDICTPPQTHHRLIIQALESGCHVIAEKPLAMNIEETKTIISAQKKSGRQVGIIHTSLFDPAMIKAISMIRKGEMGKIINVDIAITATQNDYMLSDKNHWCHSLYGGRFGEALPHPIYMLQAILGRIEVKSVHAIKTGNYSWVPFDDVWVDLEAENSRGSIYMSFNAARANWSINVYGTRGIMTINLTDGGVIILKQRPAMRIHQGIDNLKQVYQLLVSMAQCATFRVLQHRSQHELCFQSFFDQVAKNKEAMVTLQEAYDNIEILEQICRAIEILKDNKRHDKTV